MNKQDFLSELRRELHFMRQKEQDDAIEFYSEYFDESDKSEEVVITKLGSPKEIAEKMRRENNFCAENESEGEDIKNEIKNDNFGRFDDIPEAPLYTEPIENKKNEEIKEPYEKREYKKHKTDNRKLFLIIALCTFPIWLPLIFTAFAVMFSIIVTVFAVGISFFAVFISGIAASIAGILIVSSGIANISLNLTGALFSIAYGCISIGAGCLISFCFLKISALLFRLFKKTLDISRSAVYKVFQNGFRRGA